MIFQGPVPAEETPGDVCTWVYLKHENSVDEASKMERADVCARRNRIPDEMLERMCGVDM